MIADSVSVVNPVARDEPWGRAWRLDVRESVQQPHWTARRLRRCMPRWPYTAATMPARKQAVATLANRTDSGRGT